MASYPSSKDTKDSATVARIKARLAEMGDTDPRTQLAVLRRKRALNRIDTEGMSNIGGPGTRQGKHMSDTGIETDFEARVAHMQRIRTRVAEMGDAGLRD